MYINRKDGTLVEAEIRTDNYGGNPYWCITHNGKQEFLNEPEFEKQYGEAMICPNYKTCKTECTRRTVHPKNDFCGAVSDCGTLCIPYIPEQKNTITFMGCTSTISAKHKYDVDNEPVFPVCGTCNARKEQSNLSKLMMGDEEIREVNPEICACTIQGCRNIAEAQLNHLAKPDMGIYKKISTTCPTCGGGGFGKYLEPCNHCKGEGDFVKYIPLSDYLKGERK